MELHGIFCLKCWVGLSWVGLSLCELGLVGLAFVRLNWVRLEITLNTQKLIERVVF